MFLKIKVLLHVHLNYMSLSNKVLTFAKLNVHSKKKSSF